jgi:16S rRNA (cytidine1402-2'-O)-methyltransferase
MSSSGTRSGDPPGGGTLYLVATPIGNLGDVTQRALDVLGTVPLIAAEDTRITRRLLDRYEIGTKTISYHARSGSGRLAQLLEHLSSGLDLALVTDAGTPGISDPGEELVRAWAADGGEVIALPGASAVLTAIAASGLAGPRWSFEGFLPRSGRARHERLARIAADERGSVLFEAPGRVAAMLRELAASCGGDRPAAVSRELTKLHETTIRGSLAELAVAAADGTIPARGEFVIVVGSIEGGIRPTAGDVESVAVDAARSEVDRLVAAGVARGDAARRISASTGVPRRQIYGTRVREG